MGKIVVTVPRLRCIAGRYFWRPTPAVKRLGFKNTALGRDPAKAAAAAMQLNEEVKAKLGGTDPFALRKGTVAELVAAYKASPRYLQKAPNTRKQYARILREIETTTGREPLTEISRKALMALYERLQADRGLAQANAIMRVWQIVLKFAYDTARTDVHHGAKLKLERVQARARLWQPEEVERFLQACDDLKLRSMRLAFLLAYELAQRQEDVLKLAWTKWDGRAFLLKQGKTGAHVRVPLLLDSTVALVEETPRTSTQVIVCETTGEPYKVDWFRKEFRRVREHAGLPDDLQFRDLRRTAMTELGDAAATDDELRSVSGHQSRAVVAVYVRPTGTQAAHAQAKRRENRPGTQMAKAGSAAKSSG